jgi:membrane protease YdiL (CAAX protease family)
METQGGPPATDHTVVPRTSTRPPPIPADAPAPASPEFRSRRQLWIEVAAVVALAVLPDIIRSTTYDFDYADRDAASPWNQMTSILSRSIGILIPFAVLMRRSGVDVRDFGFKRFRAFRDVVLGIALWAIASYLPVVVTWPAYYAAWAVGITVENGGFSQHYALPSGAAAWSFIGVTAIVNGFTEELIVRGYLITRLSGLMSSRAAAVLISSALFGAYHMYYGWFPALHITMTGIVMGTYFTASRRLWPVIIAHMLGDVMPFVFAAP